MTRQPAHRASQPYRATRLAFMAIAMAAIFLLDTATSYEIAGSVFYTVVILTAARLLKQRALIMLTGTCIAITLLSFAMTQQGDYRAGLVNMTISIVSILITGYLVCKMEAARAAAHDAQARLMRISRVKSLEGLTTSIAHEVNQPLAAIVTSSNACQRWLAQHPANLDKARQAVERILNDAGRASSIIARVRSLTKGDPPDKTAFAFNDAVQEVLTLSQGEMLRGSIALTVDLAADLPRALADRVQIQQVMGNLILNAIEATLPVAAARRVIHVGSRWQGETIVFAVSDTGIGLPSGVREHVFEAFWTTKEEGIGVGLSISRTIIEANGGHLWAESNDHAGAVFAFSLATTDKEPA
ncbi:Sensor histidine kinase TmoS [Pseudomonas reidholzensis]|uniref:histidine kinase n=1 Tax=Pseudomonas reidholzensis TaxID=1785162 RepID=A0A383RXY3_9PSED|nr:HAMP domain-containing sensor histidine kinase [Pseudomonas reidholzensis]SYX91613.1 Sensor histidine kinase TmoS [Pseudomonas reidholzensis]